MNRTISAEEFDRRFDDGESVIEFLDLTKITKAAPTTTRRVNLDIPIDMIADLDKQARKRGVTRQALMKMWLSDKLDSAA